ncbi:3-hydroxyacyl-CoA dehydrogenase/enoyl-CoA hydratase family protein [Balneola sp. MJW-20]|uniref:3-hydroxyacyl-CoA dehydrogenase/enoyl-CoA hydratase family protein n=1 Tax=Gracilimonas aurantiaca TaxID=3234185 RepID=UPI003467A3ED
MIKYHIRKVAILGSGVMGSQIAAHCVNAGLEVLLLDLKSDDPDRPDKNAEDSLRKITKMKPAPFGLPEFAERIETGNFEDDLHKISDADWICEVIIEKLDIKKDLMSRVDEHRQKASIVSSNTSGLPIHKIAEDCSEDFKAHFLGTHFFNPPRYMKLLEVIPTEQTDERILKYMKGFCEQRLGKGVVLCKDTPNFIANRIGIFSIANIMPYFLNGNFRAEHIDKLTGLLTGYSKAATFRTADMAGLDVTYHVAANLHPEIPHDEKQDTFDLPDKFGKMVKEGMIGNKAGKGFYSKVRNDKGKTEYKVLNPETFEYESQKEWDHPTIAEAEKIRDVKERIRFLAFKEDEVGELFWDIQRDLLLYAANRIPEITEDPVAIDRAMKWGFNWELGPFERWDILGIQKVIERAESDGHAVPDWIRGVDAFYKDGKVFQPDTGAYQEVPPKAESATSIAALLSENQPVWENKSMALHDGGNGVAVFEYRTPFNTLGFELVNSLDESMQMVHDNFDALVLYHDGDNFSYGANLKEALEANQKGEWDRVVEAVEQFQRVAVKLRYSPFPVVAAPFGMTFGGGTEFSLYSDRRVAHHELYMGLVEVGVGLIPAGGGTTDLLRKAMNRVEGDADPLAYIREVFKKIGMAKVSASAHEARELGFLEASDPIVMNRDLLLENALNTARAMADNGYEPPAEPMIKVMGQTALSAMKLMLYVMSEGGFVTEYDKVVAERVAYVLAGGDLSEAQEVPESYLLKLEREAILECLKDERTLARMEHMLKTGKPLRN